MAQIDLKFAKIIISDGTSKTGAVNLGPYPAGVTTLAIDGYTGIVAVGDTFTLGEDDTSYTVTAHTETTGNTTSITFTPSTAQTASDNATLTFAGRTGAVNNSGGYTTSDFTITVDGIVGIIANDDTFTITGETGGATHTVTDHTETGGNTTSITFTTALGGSITDNAVITFDSKSGSVNRGTNYPSGTGTMGVDSFTGSLTIGQTFTIAGESGTPEHTITAHTETDNNTTSITFTPTTTGTTADNAVLTFNANSLEVNIGEGNLTYTEKRDITYVKNRGRLGTVRLGDEEPVEVALDFIWEHITSSAGDPPTIEEALKGTGTASTWTSSGADVCEPYAVDLKVIYTPPCSSEEMETITLGDFRWEELDHDFTNATVSVKGNCNVTEAVAVRAANTYPN